MRHLEGTPRSQTLLLPPSVEDYIPEDHPVRVIDAFVDSLEPSVMGFKKAQTAPTGRRPYHPGDLLKLYLYGYVNQTSSTRRLEKECHRNLEVLWLMKQLAPDFKTLADFRKDNGLAIKQVCRQFIVFCRQAGLVSGQLVAIDGSKFKAAASKDQAITRQQLEKQLGKLDQKIERYLSELAASEQEAEDLDKDKVAEAQAKLMKSGREGMVVGYNAQHAVDGQHQLIVHHELTQAGTDNQQLEPMVQGAREALGGELDTVVADAGYSNGVQISHMQAAGMTVAVPPNRAVNNQGGGEYFQKSDFIYLPEADAYQCPAGHLLSHTTVNTKDRLHLYARSGCHACPLQEKCTKADRRWVSRHFDEAALAQAGQAATPERMRRRMATVEPPFATLKRLMNKGRFTCWGLDGASSEHSLGVLSYNLMRAINVLGVQGMLARFA